MAKTKPPYPDRKIMFLCRVHNDWTDNSERADNGNRLPCCKNCKEKIDNRRLMATKINNANLKSIDFIGV